MNSGIFVRCADPVKIGADSCYEVDIRDIRPEPKYGPGARGGPIRWRKVEIRPR